MSESTLPSMSTFLDARTRTHIHNIYSLWPRSWILHVNLLQIACLRRYEERGSVMHVILVSLALSVCVCVCVCVLAWSAWLDIERSPRIPGCKYTCTLQLCMLHASTT